MRTHWIVAVAIAASPFAGGLLARPQAAAQSRQTSRGDILYAGMDRDRDGVIEAHDW